MGVVFTNNAETTLAAAITSTSATSISVTSSSTFPAIQAGEHFYATLDDGTNNEIVKVTGVSGTTWTVVRASDSTTARTFANGITVQLRATAALLTDIQENIAAKSANQTVYNATAASNATAYDVGVNPGVEANAMVFLDGVMQHHDTFSFSGSTLTFDAAPTNGTKIEVIVDNLINLQSSNLTTDTFTATSGQTAFTLSDAPAAENNLIVFIDGVFQDQGTYSISNHTLTLATGAVQGRTVTVYIINPVNIGTPSDGTVTSAKLSGNITMPGTLTVGSHDVAFDSPTFVVDNANSRVGLGTATPSVPVDIVGEVKISSHLNMPDNAIAKFGTGSDLKIYHDGSNSYIQDSGTGNLRIAGQSVDILNPDANEFKARFLDNGAAELYYDNSKKLATTSTGIDVTGTAIMDGLTVDGDATISDGNPTLSLVDTTATNQGAEFKHNAGTTTIQSSNTSTHGLIKFNSNNGTDTVTRMQIDRFGDISFYDDTGTSENLKWDASADILNFVDNAKATFGTGSDLSIYHNGAGSFIDEQGTGGLILRGTNLFLRNSADENYIGAISDGSVTLYHNNLPKLATTSTGIDVTGTVTSDGLTTSGNLDIVSSYPRINLTDTGENPDYSIINANGIFNIYDVQNNSNRLSISSTGNATFTGTVTSDGLTVDGADVFFNSGWIKSNSSLRIDIDNDNNQTDRAFFISHGNASKDIFKASENGDISFYDDTGSSQALFWDASAESLGIGTTSPSTTLELSNTSTAPILRLSNENNSITAGADLGVIEFYSGDDSGFGDLVKASISATQPLTSPVNGELVFKTSSSSTSLSEAMRISANGSVGIGTATPNYLLDVEGSGSLLRVNSTSGNNIVQLSVPDTTSITGINFGDSGSTNAGYIWYRHNGDSLAFSTAGTEAMRILSSGSVGIGTSSPSGKLDVAGVTPTLTISDTQDKSWTSSDTTLGELAFRTRDSSGIGSHNVSFIRAVNEVASSTTPSGALSFGISQANNNASEAMRIDSSGRVGIGTTSPSSLNAGANRLVVGGGANFEGLSVYSAVQGGVYFADGTTGSSTYSGVIKYVHSDNSMQFTTNASERMRIDSSGNLLVGTTALTPGNGNTNTGHLLKNDGRFFASSASNSQFNRNSDGDIVTFRQSGNLVGSIGTTSGDLNIYSTASGHKGLRFGIGYIAGTNNAGATEDAGVDLGWSGGRFKDLYLSGTANVDSGLQVGSIGNIGNVANDVVVFSSSAGHNGLRFHANGILPTDNTGAIIDADADIGISTYRFKDLHLSGNIKADAQVYATGIGHKNDTNTYIEFPQADRIIFHTGGSEAGRFDASGNLLVGTTNTTLFNNTTANTGGGVFVKTSIGTRLDISRENVCLALNRPTTDGIIVDFYKGNTSVGTISITGSATAYNTSSDARLKDVTGEARGLEVITKLNPVAYNWKADGKADEGLIAQEVKELVPNAVTGSEDEHYQMDYSKLVTHLVKAVQELEQQTIELKEEIANLKGE